METKVLYFPHINVPRSLWIMRMILYWDKVGAIVPYDFIMKPELLDSYMRDLVQAELIEQVIPGMYISKIPAFADAFMNYLESLGSQLDKRRKALKQSLGVRIHIEKMEPLADRLVSKKLAVSKGYPWYLVESETGFEFMGYLAACLGGIEELGFMPITNRPGYVYEIFKRELAYMEAEEQLYETRQLVLENVFPVPRTHVPLDQIQDFKSRHSSLLTDFRQSVEQKLVEICSITDPALRARSLELYVEGLQRDIDKIRETMVSFGWGDIIFFNKLCGLASAIPGAPALVGIAKAVYEAFGGSSQKLENSPLLYAAYTQEKLLDRGRKYTKQRDRQEEYNVWSILEGRR